MPRKSPFKIDLNVRKGQHGYDLIQRSKPAGFHERTTQPSSNLRTLSQTQINQLAAKQHQHAMAIAMRPGQQILMNAFMMYMSGSQLNIFSISITSSAILSPLAALLNINNTFAALQSIDLQYPKLAYIAMNVAWLALGLYKMAGMRLLPTTSADWAWKLDWKDMMETTSIPAVAYSNY
ncbi:hypothetical protein MPSEU_000432300 [Mayamaea pseudoterrestris]|nr:hypothetical protein MPSEU_000432300 [Mayamaea pseudoterrestris]